MFELWRDYQAAPDRCRFTDSRKKLLERFLKSHTADELALLVRYAYESLTPEASFWRGANPENREYLDLENLLRVGKVDSRVERALAWAAGEDPHDPDGPPMDGDVPDERCTCRASIDPNCPVGREVGNHVIPSGPVQPRPRLPAPAAKPTTPVPVRGRVLTPKVRT